MEELKNGISEGKESLEIAYVHMPQNDKQQIEQVVREYESEPAKGLAHGVQKDAIQNAVGARLVKSESDSYRGNWRCNFELVEIDGKEALVFWDEGTTGLTGDILPVKEIEKKSSAGLLGAGYPNQRLARFLTRFESGGNAGPGSFGRGKLIFQGASNDSSILVDSFRSDDNEYISFDRLVEGTQLVQREIPFTGEGAKKFIVEKTKGALKPLATHGTRITILNVNPEISQSFKKSFAENESETGGYSEVFSRMIEETWWEIIQFGAKITLKLAGEIKQIKLTEPLLSIMKARNGDGGEYKVFTEDNISVVVDSKVHRIKHLKFIVAPHPIEEELREVWVQRKRMKIGSMGRSIVPHYKIQKTFSGFMVLDPELEKLFEEKESPTHYGFVFRGRSGGAIHQVKEALKSRLERFHEQLGLRVGSSETRARQDMIETLNELNQLADRLGLPTEFSSGPRKKTVEISIDSFLLPSAASSRVEMGDKVGPVVYRLKNFSNKPQLVKVEITGEQRGKKPVALFAKDIDLGAEASYTFPFEFKIEPSLFALGEGVLIRARVYRRTSPPETMSQVTRMLWVGMDQPIQPKDCIRIIGYEPDFPRPESRRVELEEVIRNIHFRITNESSVALKLNLDLKIRKSKSSSQDVHDLVTLISERNLELLPLADRDFAIDELQITETVFGGIFKEALEAKERRAEIFFSVRAAENYPTFKKILGDHLGPKKSIPFFCGVDAPGMSIFKTILEKNEPEDGKRSWVEGDKASGYTFVLNVGHSVYRLADDLGDGFRKHHIREQMLLQAYLVAVGENIFKGTAEPFREFFEEEEIDPIEATRKIDEMVGLALNQWLD